MNTTCALLLMLTATCWTFREANGASLNHLKLDLNDLPHLFANRASHRHCPITIDPPNIRLNSALDMKPKILVNHHGRPFSGLCQHIARCDVLTTSPDVELMWYSIDNDGNEQLLVSEVQRDHTLDTLDERPTYDERIVGISEALGRLCLDPYIVQPNQTYRFKCKARLICHKELEVESDEMSVRVSSDNYFDASKAILRAPLITMLTASRIEIVGRVLQFFCYASGSPRPRIEWTVMDNLVENKFYPIEDYPFLKMSKTDSLIVNTKEIQDGAIAFQCRAVNVVGQDKDLTTLILLAPDEDE